MKKIFGMLLVCVMMIGFISPVFAVEGDGSSTTDVEYVVEGSFTWSVPAKITVGTADNKGTGVVQITSNNLGEGKGIFIRLEGSSNYNNGFNLKKTGDNTLYPYVLGFRLNETDTPIEAEPAELNPISVIRTTSHENLSTTLIAYFENDSDKPTTAGTYTDTLTFVASAYDND